MKCFNFSIRRAELKIYQGHFLLRVCLCVSVCVCVCVSICVSVCAEAHLPQCSKYMCGSHMEILGIISIFYLGLGSVSSAKCMYVVLPTMGFQGYYFLYNLHIFLWGTGSPYLIPFFLTFKKNHTDNFYHSYP